MHSGVLINYLYTYFFTIIFCIMFQIGFYFKTKKIYLFSIFYGCMFFYSTFSLVYKVTQIGTIWDIGRYETLIRANQINLIPFASKGMTTYVLNILLFMPLGFLLPTIWLQFRRMKSTAYAGFGFSLAIELGQLLDNRITDIDDLSMNTLGAIIGYLLYRVLFKMIYKRDEKKVDNNISLVIKYEAIFYLVCSFVGMMLIYYPVLFRRPLILQ